MFRNFNFLNEVTKIVSFLYGVFILADIVLIFRILFKNYGEKLEWNNIYKTVIICGTLTLLLYILKKILTKLNN